MPATQLTALQRSRKIVVSVLPNDPSIYKDIDGSMANHFSALKRARQTEKRTARNRANKSRLRSALRHLREAIAKGDKETAQQAYRATVSALDKSVQKGVLHDNTASRYKARLATRLQAGATK